MGRFKSFLQHLIKLFGWGFFPYLKRISETFQSITFTDLIPACLVQQSLPSSNSLGILDVQEICSSHINIIYLLKSCKQKPGGWSFGYSCTNVFSLNNKLLPSRVWLLLKHNRLSYQNDYFPTIYLLLHPKPSNHTSKETTTSPKFSTVSQENKVRENATSILSFCKSPWC